MENNNMVDGKEFSTDQELMNTGPSSDLTEEQKVCLKSDTNVEQFLEDVTPRRIKLSREDLTVKINGIRLTLVQIDENGELNGLKAMKKTKRKLESRDYTDLINEMYVKYVEGVPTQYGEFNKKDLDDISIKPVSIRIEEWLRRRRAERGTPQPTCFSNSFVSTLDDILKSKDDY